jgi:hypothetical protein
MKIGRTQKQKDYAKKYYRRYYLRKKALIFETLGNRCNSPTCHTPGRETDIRCLQIDHVNGGGNQQKFKSVYLYFNYILENPSKFQLLCANCNWIKRVENEESNPFNKRKKGYKNDLHVNSEKLSEEDGINNVHNENDFNEIVDMYDEGPEEAEDDEFTPEEDEMTVNEEIMNIGNVDFEEEARKIGVLPKEAQKRVEKVEAVEEEKEPKDVLEEQALEALGVKRDSKGAIVDK